MEGNRAITSPFCGVQKYFLIHLETVTICLTVPDDDTATCKSYTELFSTCVQILNGTLFLFTARNKKSRNLDKGNW